mmetsp:Transcript_29491/g.55204  ORF Transcript_29491/g.55204 Transcript_29491/m.55204 type:complete len:400 (+) Transcript_29491:156-1355(+)
MARWLQGHGHRLRILMLLACAQTAKAVSSPALLQDDAQAPVCLLQRTSMAAARAAASHGQEGQSVPDGGSLDSVSWQGVGDDAASVSIAEDPPKLKPVDARRSKGVPAGRVRDDLRDTLKVLLEHQISAIRSKSSSNDNFVREDELLRFQDDRLRQQDADLRQENQRLQLALAQLSSSGNHSSELMNQETAASLFASLVASPAFHQEGFKPLLVPPVMDKDSNASHSKNASDATMAKHQMVMTLVYIGGIVGFFIAYVLYHLWAFFNVKRADKDGDGNIDMDDFKEYMSETICCGLSYHAAKKVSFVLLLAAAGFAFLWWQGIIQPFLKELVCYIYLGSVLFLLLGVILAEMFSQFTDIFYRVSSMLEHFMSIAHLDSAQDAAQAVMKQAGLKRSATTG